ncbi:2,3-dihydro-2,3-dihydroxybenzoate dehydrogenase [Amycolatopsis rubida]|uniref:2,3-dihydro-2,3-dihydroxybenzoate dehydrogenase n=1 Tax=Amycolatopsis rubida TaxID=112413 RepID=UPI000B8990B6
MAGASTVDSAGATGARTVDGADATRVGGAAGARARTVDGTGAARVGAADGVAAAQARTVGDAGVPVDAQRPAGAGRVVPFVADVGDPGAVARVVADVERELGPIGIGVSVAGVLRPGSVVETSDEDWAATFAVNATGVFAVLREISRRMQPRGSGVLVTVGSNAAGVPRAGMAAYAASKAAATMLTRCLGLELAGAGIRCNIVSPGSTDTEMQRLLWTDDSGEARVVAGNPEQFRVGIPLGRIADPADIADAVLFLASDRARHITMQNLYVDGGATLRA